MIPEVSNVYRNMEMVFVRPQQGSNDSYLLIIYKHVNPPGLFGCIS